VEHGAAAEAGAVLVLHAAELPDVQGFLPLQRAPRLLHRRLVLLELAQVHPHALLRLHDLFRGVGSG